MVSDHGQERASRQFLSVHGAERQRGKGANEVMQAALEAEEGAGLVAVSVRPGPVRNPAEHAAAEAKRSALRTIVRQAQLGEAIRRGQEHQSAVSYQGFRSQTSLAQGESEIFQEWWTGHRDHLLADFETRGDEFRDFRQTAVLSHNQSARGTRRRIT